MQVTGGTSQFISQAASACRAAGDCRGLTTEPNVPRVFTPLAAVQSPGGSAQALMRVHTRALMLAAAGAALYAMNWHPVLT